MVSSNINKARATETKILITVNDHAITNYDIAKRIALLKLQNYQGEGNLEDIAKKELIDEMLRSIEIKKNHILISDNELNKAFATFAEKNHMTSTELSKMLDQANVTSAHFKKYIEIQIAWEQLFNEIFQKESFISEEEAVQRILKNGGIKPQAKEYRLQQIIFVIPKNSPSTIISTRRQEANRFRNQIHNCTNLQQKAQGLIDVTIRDLGYILEHQIPFEWKKRIIKTAQGNTTQIQNTVRGLEFLIICSIQNVSDDRVARFVFSIQDNRLGKKAIALEKRYMKELHAKANIRNL
ncbi:MAG: peptidyl-prolyl cis-trans isomerase C [Candidatus Tokpelaia sp. JSC161]|jgi:peptidyl-prolyl cis-trans isomerase SurA|nr:MAG: peptidyl-prolyl cis-trans isomerase C [Candidatus Tokpelaia sp. JSC161]